MKNYIISLLQKMLGYERYLFLFAKLKIRLLKFNKKKETFRHFLTLVPENGTVAIVGASIGIKTLPFANKRRTVIAYEPIPSNFSVLQKLKATNKVENLSLFQIALGNRSGQIEMVFPEINGAKKHGLSYVKDLINDGNPNGEILLVNIDRLDDRPELASQKLIALKVVAENYEFEIFEGAKDLIRRDLPLIYCELWANSKRQPVLDLIRAMNYRVHILVQGKLVNYTEYKSTYRGKHFIFLPGQ